MIRKSTLIILLIALLAGGAVYYFDWKRGEKQKDKLPEDTSKLAFTAQAADITSFTISHPARPNSPAVVLQKHDDVWQITQPINTPADPNSSESIASDIASARISGIEPGTPDRLKAYNLDPPQMVLDFQLQNGSKHTIRFGDRDFTGTSAYSIVDSSKDVSLLPYSLFSTSDKTADDLRDHAALRFVGNDIASFDLKNPSGEIAAAKEKSEWKFTKPAGKPADASDVTSLLNTVSVAKMTIVSETAENLSKYGLSNPTITFHAADAKGKSYTLLVGRKIDNNYFARDSSRPLIFRINEELYKKLAEGYADLRDKKIVHLDPHDVNRIEVRNSNGTSVFTRKAEKDKDEDWTVESPAEQKGKTVGSWKFFSPTVDARAESVLDNPSPKIAASLTKPAITVTLSSVDGKKLTLDFSAASDDSTYCRSSDGPAVYKLNKKTFQDLDFKVKDLVF
jgi:hypothetical protein